MMPKVPKWEPDPPVKLSPRAEKAADLFGKALVVLMALVAIPVVIGIVTVVVLVVKSL